MTGRQVNIYLQEKTYNAVRQLVGPRQISRYINQALEEKLAHEQKNVQEELRQQLIAGYKANAKNKKLQTELGVWEKISTHDILTQIEEMKQPKKIIPKPNKISRIPHQGEIWLVEFPKIKEFSKPFRPALVISNNLQNEFDNLVTVATLTTDDVENVKPFEVFIENNEKNGLDYPSKILTGYSFSIYKERLIERLGMAERKIMDKVKIALQITFDLKN